MFIKTQLYGMLFASLLISSVLSMGDEKNKDPKFEDPIFIPPAPQKVEPSASNAFRILYVGNSITRHGIYPERKWDHVAGMAASSEENDYAHRLAAMIQAKMPNRKVELYFDNVNKLRIKNNTLGPLAGKNLPHPDLVVIQTGEHEGPSKSKEEISQIYEKFIVKPFYKLSPRPLILCTGLWYVTDGKPYTGWVKGINDAYKDVCQKYNIPFVSVESLASDPSCRGWGEDPGVKWHPNDKGMKGYADLLFEAYKKATKRTELLFKNNPILISENFRNKNAVNPNFRIDLKNWEISDNGLKVINGINRMISFDVGEKNWQDYEIEFRIKRIKLNPKDQHFGLYLRCDGDDLSKTNNSLLFYSEGGRICFREMIGGRQVRLDVLGLFSKSLDAGENSPWVIFRFVLKGTQAKVYVDNTLIGIVTNIIPENGKIVFYAYNLELCLDYFKVLLNKSTNRPLPTQNNVSNILNNSGFEQCTLDKLPDYWGCSHFGIVDPYWVVNYEKWVNNYGVDEHDAFEGKRSMRINNPFDKKNESGLCLRSVCVGAKVKQKYMLSAYMKSNPCGMKVNFNGKEIILTNQWQRYSNIWTNDSTRGLYGDMVNIYPLSKGTFWIDAVQLEEGKSPTPYNCLHKNLSLQVQEGKIEKVITEVPKLELKKLSKKITLDGRLIDPAWSNIESLNLVNRNGQAAENKTEAKLWYSNDGLYIGVKCFDENAGKNVCKVLQRDGNIWDDPSLELFIDPKLTRNYYYHFGLNQFGVQFDAFCGDTSWDGSWKAATYTDPAGKYWSAEVFLPFGEMGINRGTGEWWGFNICRSNSSTGEYSCWSPTFGGFHTPERFGQVRIAQDALNRYSFDCCNAELQRVSDNKIILVAKMVNNSGQNGHFQLEATVENTVNKQTITFRQPLTLADGENKVITLGEIVGTANAKYNLRIRLCSEKGEKVYYTSNKYLEMPCYFQLLPQYSLYTNEKEMLVNANINLSDDKLSDAKLTIAICNFEGKTVSNKELLNLNREINMALSIKDLVDGKYALIATLKNKDGKKLSTLKIPFQKISSTRHIVRVDHFSRMVTIDNKGFMPLGFCWEGELTQEVLEYLSKNGVNSVAFFPHWNYFKTQSVLDNAEKVGIKIRLCASADNKERIVKFMDHFKKHPALLAWDIFDEAFTVQWGKDNYQFICASCAELKEIDPCHPVFINENQYGISYLRSKNLEFPGDIVSIDYYAWTPSGNIPVTSMYAQLMELMGRKDGRPSWIYLMGAGYAFWASRDFTPAEHKFSAYAAVINGVSGIYYFASHPKSPSAWKQIKRLFLELKELTPIIASAKNISSLKCTAPSIEFLTKRYNGSLYLIAVNNSQELVDARFDLSNLNIENGKTAEVLFEKRKIKITNQVMADTFEGYQRHVYKISGSEQ